MKTMNFKEAEKHLTELVHRNPEKRDYYFQLADCVGASCDQNRLLEFYQVMQKTFPRAKVSTKHLKIPENKILISSFQKQSRSKSSLEVFSKKLFEVIFLKLCENVSQISMLL